MKADIEATAERIAKLPAWARDHIESLERKVHEADTFITDTTTLAVRDENKGIVVNPYRDRALVLPDDATLRFWLEPAVFAIDVHMRSHLYGPNRPALAISGNGLRKSSSIIIWPSASNVVHVTGEVK